MAIIIYNFNLGQQIGAAAFRLSAGHLASPRQFLALQCPLCDLQPCLPAMTCARPIILQAPPAHFPISRHFPQFPPHPNIRGKRAQKVSDSDRRPQQGHLCFAAGQCYSSCSCFSSAIVFVFLVGFVFVWG